jgi:secreted trypsin-like serine protease
VTIRLAALALALAGALAGPAATAADQRADPVRHPNVVGGYRPHPTQWPWMAAITFKGTGPDVLSRQFCGGALIAPALVLTAAHCVVDAGTPGPPEVVQVVLGRRNLDTDAGGEIIDVARITPHPSYRRDGLDSYDLALLDLAHTSTAQPAAFADPTVVVPEGTRATVMGWGRTGPRRSDPKSANLFAADLPLWGGERCKVAYGRRLHLPSAVCAGYMDGRVDSCLGDGGGPLMVPDAGGTWRLVGVVSSGPDCGSVKLPGVYAWLGALEARRFIATRLPGVSTAPPPAASATPRSLRVVGVLGRDRRVRVRFDVDEPGVVRIGVFRRRGEQLVRVGASIDHDAVAGVNRLRLGRGSVGRRLARGRYVLVAEAVAAPGSLRYARLRVSRAGP